MFLRSILTIINSNNNSNTTVMGERVVFSKPLSRFTVKNTYNKTQNDWKDDVTLKIIIHI